MPIKLPARNIKVQKNGDGLAGRMSSDLVALKGKDDSFAWETDSKKRVLILRGDGPKNDKHRLKVWGTNDRSRAGSIGLLSVMKELGIKHPEKLIGKEFDAEVDGNTIEIKF